MTVGWWEVFLIVLLLAALIIACVALAKAEHKPPHGATGACGARGATGFEGPTGETGATGPVGGSGSVVLAFSLGAVGDDGVPVLSDVSDGVSLGQGSSNGANIGLDNPSAGQRAMELMAFTVPVNGVLGNLNVSTRFTVGDGNSQQLIVGIWKAPATGVAFSPTDLTVLSPLTPAFGTQDLSLVDSVDTIPVTAGERITLFTLCSDPTGSINLFRLSASCTLLAT